MCVEIRRHVKRQIASAIELMVGARNEAELQATVAHREHGADDVFEIYDAGNPVGSALRHQAYGELGAFCRHSANSKLAGGDESTSYRHPTQAQLAY